MQSTLNPKQSDDPHDFVVVAPDAVRVAPAEEELSNLLHDAARHLSDSQTRTENGLPAGPPVPPVDTSFRPAAVDAVEVPGHRGSTGRGAARAFHALLLAGCIGAAAFAWRSWGDTAEKKIAKWTTQFVMTASQPSENSGAAAQPAPPAVQADATNAAAPQPAPSAQSAAEAVAAATPESEQLLQSMSRDLASLGQEVVQLKASIEQLRASQQQMSRDVAKASEQNLRPRISAPPPRVAAAPARKPIPPYPPPQAAATRALPQSITPSAVPPPESQTTARPQVDPELASVPRPPMPLR